MNPGTMDLIRELFYRLEVNCLADLSPLDDDEREVCDAWDVTEEMEPVEDPVSGLTGGTLDLALLIDDLRREAGALPGRFDERSARKLMQQAADALAALGREPSTPSPDMAKDGAA